MKKSIKYLLLAFIMTTTVCLSSFALVGCKKELDITADFEGGNIQVVSIEEDMVKLKVDLRDTTEDWFYWCFRVDNAEGKTLKFEFVDEAGAKDNRVGYYGAAVSYDLENWTWQQEKMGYQGARFTYTFGEDESSVYFAHDMVYRPSRFIKFAEAKGLEIKEFCKSEKGASVPYVEFGSGEQTIVLTSRHHACESTGSYVLEGVVEEALSSALVNDFKFIVIPFVDYDGVIAGDQGKNRAPYDHNRDYDSEKQPIYKVVEKIRGLSDTENVRFAFDFHSPWHLGNENDTVFMPYKTTDETKLEKLRNLSSIWEQKTKANANSLIHYASDDLEPYEVDWNVPNSPTYATWFNTHGAEFAVSIETPYFMTKKLGNLGMSTYQQFTMENAVELGKCFTQALIEYIG